MSIMHYEAKRELDGYIVYDLSTDPDKKWSVAILDLEAAPVHFHKLGVENFTILDGELDITLDGVRYILGAGRSIKVPIGTRHELKSASKERPVRLLCVNFPAFDPDDMLMD